ncbi:hypothetical protein ACKKBG_A12630 [Auxenochlorella protothecoides x Auxenochlorella symbiontica]
MAPASKSKPSKADLIGRRVLVPESVWPDEPPPAGKKGWEGTVEHARGPNFKSFYVSFPTDPSTYWFSAADIQKWLLPKSAKDSKRQALLAPAKKRRSDPSADTAPAQRGNGMQSADTAAAPKQQDVNTGARAEGPEEPGMGSVFAQPEEPAPFGFPPASMTPVSTGRPSLDALIDVAQALTDEDMNRLTHKAKKLRSRSLNRSSLPRDAGQ